MPTNTTSFETGTEGTNGVSTTDGSLATVGSPSTTETMPTTAMTAPTTSHVAPAAATSSSSVLTVSTATTTTGPPFGATNTTSATRSALPSHTSGCYSYTVLQGDTAASIAAKHGATVAMMAIMFQNEHIHNLIDLTPGQNLFLPITATPTSDLQYAPDCIGLTTGPPVPTSVTNISSLSAPGAASTGTSPQLATESSGITTFRGQLPLNSDMQITVRAGTQDVYMMIDTSHQCSWFVNGTGFGCLGAESGPAPRPTDACSPQTRYGSQNRPVMRLSDPQTEQVCGYQFGRTKVFGSEANATLQMTDSGSVDLSNLLIATRMESAVFNLDNFIHKADGLLSILGAPPECAANLTQTRTNWNQGPSDDNIVYIAARRNTETTDGIFSRGTIPTVNSTIDTSHLNISATLAANVSREVNDNITECDWGVRVDGIDYGQSNDSASTSPIIYVVSTLSRFNFVGSADAGEIGKLFAPPAAYNDVTGLLEVGCQATLSIPRVSVIIGGKDFTINKADMIVRAFPPDYSQCFSASQSHDHNRELSAGRYWLGWPFLRNAGVALDLGSGVWNITSRPGYDD